MIEPLETGSPKIVGYRLRGRLGDEEYRALIPALEERLAAQGTLRVLVLCEDFDGMDMRAFWQDIRFATKHYTGFERIAVVGDGLWETWLARLSKPFTRAAVKHYKASQEAQAWAWLRADI